MDEDALLLNPGSNGFQGQTHTKTDDVDNYDDDDDDHEGREKEKVSTQVGRSNSLGNVCHRKLTHHISL